MMGKVGLSGVGDIKDLLNKVGLSGVGDITDLVNKGELEDVDGIDDIKDFINEKNESAKIWEPLKTGSIRRWILC
jgi:hypothetical protein